MFRFRWFSVNVVGVMEVMNLNHLVHATKKLDGIFEQLPKRDAEIVQEPTEQAYGVRDCAVRDPAGNLMRIQQLRPD